MMMENANEVIRSAEVRAVFPDGSVEVMPTAVAVRKAKAMGLDLILIAPSAIPPVAKIMRVELNHSSTASPRE